jgi:hypothetical protein
MYPVVHIKRSGHPSAVLSSALRFFRTYVGLLKHKFGVKRPTYLPTYPHAAASGRKTYLPTYLPTRSGGRKELPTYLSTYLPYIM